MWMYSLGRALLDTTPRVAALMGTVSVSPSSALQSVLAAMTEPDPRRRASLMNLLDVSLEILTVLPNTTFETSITTFSPTLPANCICNIHYESNDRIIPVRCVEHISEFCSSKGRCTRFVISRDVPDTALLHNYEYRACSPLIKARDYRFWMAQIYSYTVGNSAV